MKIRTFISKSQTQNPDPEPSTPTRQQRRSSDTWPFSLHARPSASEPLRARAAARSLAQRENTVPYHPGLGGIAQGCQTSAQPLCCRVSSGGSCWILQSYREGKKSHLATPHKMPAPSKRARRGLELVLFGFFRKL
uniref:Uncharacterized protein n=1 Tax=Micrurus corallinus TaxID=54390 RepID=A0A2D4FEC8_MICCO